jgi:hypothetical protein
MTDTPRPRTTRRQPVKKQPPSTSTNDRESSLPSEEEIRRRAYQLYEQRGAEPGRDKEDWERAEQELRGHDSPRPN